ncbi:MAG: hypothetical protein OEV35_02360 [Gallionellaceae bacterium]|nr:hypothetical protein [Gallionellaceae bacterium]
MILTKADFHYFRWSLLVFLLVLVAGNTVIVASKNFIEDAQRDQREARRQLNEVRARLATANADHENMHDYMLEYNALLKRNVVGSDQRLDWVEGLDKIRLQGESAGQIDFAYSILPQKAYVPSPPLETGNFELNRSDMTLQFNLLHEERLMVFFDRVHSDINGWFMLDKCILERTSTAPEDPARGTAEYLKAECAGGWVTLKDRRAPK